MLVFQVLETCLTLHLWATFFIYNRLEINFERNNFKSRYFPAVVHLCFWNIELAEVVVKGGTPFANLICQLVVHKV